MQVQTNLGAPDQLTRAQPEYPGTVFAFANTVANTAGIIGPEMMNRLVTDPTSHGSWSSLWMISALIFAIGGVVFCIFAQNQPQNYCRKPKPGSRTAGSKSLSEAQLTQGKSPLQEIFKMDAFSRVGAEPELKRVTFGTNRQ